MTEELKSKKNRVKKILIWLFVGALIFFVILFVFGAYLHQKFGVSY